MKINYILYLSIYFLLLLSKPIAAQTLADNKIDEFTNDTIARTSWEHLNYSMKFTAFFRITRINDNVQFDLKLMLGSGAVFAIDKDQEIMFKLDCGEFVKLQNSAYTITCTGCGAKGFAGSGAQGIKTSYFISKEELTKLRNYKVVKMRIYTTDGYLEADVKSGTAEKISKAIKLIFPE